MDNDEKTGGPAFPGRYMAWVIKVDDNENGTYEYEMVNGPGMTLRDYFAAKAMAATISSCPHMQDNQIAHMAYETADAMIAAREGN